MDSQVVKLAEETLGRYDALTQELSDPNIFDDQRRYAGVARNHARMRRGAELSRELLEAMEAGRDARELIPQAENTEEREFFAAEAREAEERIEDDERRPYLRQHLAVIGGVLKRARRVLEVVEELF